MVLATVICSSLAIFHLIEVIISLLGLLVCSISLLPVLTLFFLEITEHLLVDISLSLLHFTIFAINVFDTTNVFNFIIFMLLADFILVCSDLSIVSHATFIVFLFVSFQFSEAFLLFSCCISSSFILFSLEIFLSSLLAYRSASSLLLDSLTLHFGVHLILLDKLDTRLRLLHLVHASLLHSHLITLDFLLFLFCFLHVTFESVNTCIHYLQVLVRLSDLTLQCDHISATGNKSTLVGLVERFQLTSITISISGSLS